MPTLAAGLLATCADRDQHRLALLETEAVPRLVGLISAQRSAAKERGSGVTIACAAACAALEAIVSEAEGRATCLLDEVLELAPVLLELLLPIDQAAPAAAFSALRTLQLLCARASRAQQQVLVAAGAVRAATSAARYLADQDAHTLPDEDRFELQFCLVQLLWHLSHCQYPSRSSTASDTGTDAQQQQGQQPQRLGAVVTHSALPALVAEPGCLRCLVHLLLSPDRGCRGYPATTLGVLAAHSPESLQAVVDAGAVPPLVGMLEDSNPSCAAAAASTLTELASNSELRTIIVYTDAVVSLVRLLLAYQLQPEVGPRMPSPALRCLAVLSSVEAAHPYIVHNRALPHLVGMLGIAPTARDALEVLVQVSLSAEFLEDLAAARVVPGVVALLQAPFGGPACRPDVLQLLQRLAEHPSGRAAVVADALPLLVGVANDAAVAPVERKDAMAALLDACRDARFHAVLESGGVLPLLVGLISDPGWPDKDSACQALRDLVATSEHNQHTATQAGAIGALAALIGVGMRTGEEVHPAAMRTTATAALGNLAKTSLARRKAIADTPGLVHLLTAQLDEHTAPPLQRATAQAIRNIALGNAAAARSLLAAGVLHPLVHLISQADMQASTAADAALALGNLAGADPVVCLAAIEAGAALPLVHLLVGGRVETMMAARNMAAAKSAAALALGQLARGPDHVRDVVLAAGVGPPLEALISDAAGAATRASSDQDWELISSCCSLVALLAPHPELDQSADCPALVDALLVLLQQQVQHQQQGMASSFRGAQLSAAAALAGLLKHNQAALQSARVAAPAVMAAARSLLFAAKERPAGAESAAAALWHLVCAGDNLASSSGWGNQANGRTAANPRRGAGPGLPNAQVLELLARDKALLRLLGKVIEEGSHHGASAVAARYAAALQQMVVAQRPEVAHLFGRDGSRGLY